MRVLFVLEPVIFRDDPIGLRAHFPWLDVFEAAVRELRGQFRIAASVDVCRAWQQLAGGRLDEQLHVLDAFGALADYGHERVRYAKATYSRDADDARNPAGDFRPTGSLTCQLKAVRARFNPQLVIMSAQNALAARAFDGMPVLYIEQAPLPRLGHPLRTMIDPRGHQRGSVLETEADRIKSLPLTPSARAGAGCLLDAISRSLGLHPSASEAGHALAQIRGGDTRVALLATQPTDAVTYEGAGDARALENTLYAWAKALPPGWAAVPTYHAGQRLSPAMEAALVSACPQMRLLPASLSQGLTEVLLPHVDGLVTISSSTVMTALLLGKKAVVTGLSPYQSWCSSDPARLDDVRPLTRSEAESSLCFLTHRYAYAHQRWVDRPHLLAELMQRLVNMADPAAWQLDVSTWTLERALALFNFTFCVAPRGKAAAYCARERLERQAAGERERAEDYRAQFERAVAGHEQAERERAVALAERASFHDEWAKAVAQRDRAESDLAALRGRLKDADRKQLLRDQESADLERELVSAKAQLRRSRDERAAFEAEREELAGRAASARLDADETRGALADAQAQHAGLEQALSEQRRPLQRHGAPAEGELARLIDELAAARDAAAIPQGTIEQAAAELDALHSERVDLRARCEQLRQELMMLAPSLEAARRVAAPQDSKCLEWEAVAADWERKLQALETERVAHGLALDALGAERDRLGGELANLLVDRDDLRAALADAQARCEQADEQSMALARRLEETAAQCDEARAALGAADAQRLQLEAALAAARADLAAVLATHDALQADHAELQQSNATLADTGAGLVVQIEAARAEGSTIRQELDASHDRRLTLQGLLDTAIVNAHRAGSTLAQAVMLHDAAHDEHLLAMAALYKVLDDAIVERNNLDAELLEAQGLAEHFQKQARRADDRAAVSEGEFARLAMSVHASPAWRVVAWWKQRRNDGGHAELRRRVRAVANAVHVP